MVATPKSKVVGAEWWFRRHAMAYWILLHEWTWQDQVDWWEVKSMQARTIRAAAEEMLVCA